MNSMKIEQMEDIQNEIDNMLNDLQGLKDMHQDALPFLKDELPALEEEFEDWVWTMDENAMVISGESIPLNIKIVVTIDYMVEPHRFACRLKNKYVPVYWQKRIPETHESAVEAVRAELKEFRKCARLSMELYKNFLDSFCDDPWYKRLWMWFFNLRLMFS